MTDHSRPSRQPAGPSRRILVVAILAGFASIVAGCAAASPNASPSEPRPSPAEADLARIVVSPDDPPLGMSHDETADGRQVLTWVILSRRGPDLDPVASQPGFVAGRLTTFSGESGALLSWGLLFDSPANAERAFDLYLDELGRPDGYGLDVTARTGLGQEGVCSEGDVVWDKDSGATLHETICLWRIDRLVLAAGGPMGSLDLRTVADRMDQRAREVVGGSSADAGA